MKREYFKIHKEVDKKTEEEIVKFYEESGLKEVFEKQDVKNIKDYYFGVEVGLDTNARKNRKGKQMESITENYLERDFPSSNIIPQASKSRIKDKWGIELDFEEIKTNKHFDFAVLSEENNLYLIEVNYYSGGGSKLKSTAGEYQNYEAELKEENAKFIWITDGKGWETAKNPLEETFINNDFVLNLKMVSEGILTEIIK